MNYTNDTNLSRKEIERRVKEAIQNYVNSHNRKNERIESKKQIIDDICAECKEANLLSSSSTS